MCQSYINGLVDTGLQGVDQQQQSNDSDDDVFAGQQAVQQDRQTQTQAHVMQSVQQDGNSEIHQELRIQNVVDPQIITALGLGQCAAVEGCKDAVTGNCGNSPGQCGIQGTADAGTPDHIIVIQNNTEADQVLFFQCHGSTAKPVPTAIPTRAPFMAYL